MTASLTPDEIALAMDCAPPSFLGSGTYGETWLLTEFDVDGAIGSYALKALHPQLYNAALVDRETAGLRRFDSDGIVHLHDVREVAFESGARTVLLCEYIEGGSVTAALQARGLPTLEETIGFARALLAIVEDLHEQDQIHRDIKPDNVILRGGDWARPVLIDFGLSRGLSDDTLTAYPALVGTVTYMSPEQLRGEKARKASDIWACGVLLYQLISGRHPYIDDLAGLMIDDLIDLVVGPPRALPDGVPLELDELVTRMLSDHEYQRGSARRSAADLGRIAL